jgi:hypothetical protein
MLRRKNTMLTKGGDSSPWCSSSMSQPYFGQVWGWSPTLGKIWDWSCRNPSIWTLTLPSELPCWELVRVGVPKGLPKIQRAFWGVKTSWLVALLISMESSWSVDV